MSGMFSKWFSNSGICDISVLGYSSKIFRDDEKAQELEQGKHLITWMGDASTTIDRFDVRAYLSDLNQFNVRQEYKVGEEEKEIENLCEKERYKALLDIEGDEDIYEEEEQNRIKHSLNGNHKYSQVSYNYEDSSDTARVESHDAPFKPDPELEFPPNIVLPTSSNLSKIIEKTASCVFQHGKQMEIFIKARQSNNNKFDFMKFENDLNSYYQFLLNRMKTGNFKGAGKHTGNLSSHKLSSKPKLLDGMELAPGVCPPMTDHCPYTMLVDKIQNIHKVEEDSKLFNQTINSRNTKC